MAGLCEIEALDRVDVLILTEGIASDVSDTLRRRTGLLLTAEVKGEGARQL